MKKALIALCGVLYCNCGHSITWEEAIIAAFNNNDSWHADQMDKSVADEAYVQAWRALLLPNVTTSLVASRGKTENSNYLGRSNEKATGTRMSVTVSQNVFNGFSSTNTLKASDNNAKAALYKLRVSEQQLILNVLDAYMGIWVGREKVKALKKKEKNLKKIMDSQQMTLDAGAGTTSEVASARANYQKAVYERINAETELFTAESNFKKLTGISAGEELTLPDINKNLPKTLEELEPIVQKNNPHILQAKFSELAAQNRLNSERGKLAPSCDVSLQAGRNLNKRRAGYPDPMKDSQNTYSAEVAVRFDIFANANGTNTYSAISIANKELTKATCVLKDTTAEIAKNCVSIWNTYISATAMIKACLLAVKSAEQSSENNLQESSQGLKSSTETLTIENQLLESTVDLANSRKQLVMAVANIYALMGALNLSSILKIKQPIGK